MSERPDSEAGVDDTVAGDIEKLFSGVDESFEDEQVETAYELTDLGNVKQEWESLTIYLPEDLQNALNLTYRQVSYECLRSNQYDLQKLQDFYPLLIAVGLNSLKQSDTADVLSMLEYIQTEYR